MDLAGMSHTSSITSIAFGSRVNTFATGTVSGEIKVWDLTDYACQSMTRESKSGSVLSLCVMANDTLLLSGWENGFLRCHDLESLNRLVWYVPEAHRGGTTSIAACSEQDSQSRLQYIVTGGADGAVRVWRMSNRELVAQFTEHSKSVSKVLIDNMSPNIVHSVGQDCSVLTYDLKANRRVICHMTKGGVMTDMTQRKDSERELITCDTHGRLLHWDCDVRDPVFSVQDAGKMPLLRTCAISPSGRFLAFAGDDHVLKVLDVASSHIAGLGLGHCDTINTLAWTPDERQILTGGADNSLCIWNFFLGGQ
jgi:WD40 repeat protein